MSFFKSPSIPPPPPSQELPAPLQAPESPPPTTEGTISALRWAGQLPSSPAISTHCPEGMPPSHTASAVPGADSPPNGTPSTAQ